MIAQEKYISTGEAARLLGLHSQTVKKWITDGVIVGDLRQKLRGFRLGRYYYTTEEDLAEFRSACNGGKPPSVA